MDFTTISRSTNPGSGIGTNFESVPFGNTAAGSLTETRLSIQNSRVGVRQCVCLMFVTHNLERIADHATNIAEDVIYRAEGVDVRHHSEAAR